MVLRPFTGLLIAGRGTIRTGIKYSRESFNVLLELYERQIQSVDGQIDRLVYELYGLSEEEIRIVEQR